MAVPRLFELLTKRRSTQSADDAYQLDQQQPRTVAAKQYELPKIDGNDVLGSLSGILGPSPEERAAEEKRLQEHRRKMHGWTALFNGLRHLGNLYYASKGAPGQKYGDPHQQIEQQYQDERKRLADIHDRNQKYYANLWGLYRQMSDEQRRNSLAEAQAQYYGTRDEMARQKSELEKLKAVRVIKQKDGSLMKFDPVSGEAEPLSDADPLYEEYTRSLINRNNRIGTGRNNSNHSYKRIKRFDPETGDEIIEYIPTNGEGNDDEKTAKRRSGEGLGWGGRKGNGEEEQETDW